MSIKSFLKLVEIQTKVASQIPLFIGTIYAVYRFQQFNLINFILMFVSLFTFDMCTTAINNFLDFKNAMKKHGYGYEKHNAMGMYQLKDSTALAIIFTLLIVASAAGVLLVLNTGWVILMLGMISFGIGILYSFGPVPISRMPLGELFSGLFMGFLIIFISVFIHVDHPQLIEMLLANGIVQIRMNLVEIGFIFLVSLPATFGIANIMLANNICDMEEDIENKRYTLPIYIGKEKSLLLFKAATYAAYVDVIVLFFLGVHPLILLLMLLTMIPVRKNLNVFMANQSKEHTFVIAVKNFVLTNVVRLGAIGAAVLIRVII